MNDILKITPGDVVAIVGAGGKTALACALARELARDMSVAYATTARMYPQDEGFDVFNFLETRPQPAPTTGRPSLWHAGIDPDGKCVALDDRQVAKLAAACDVVIVEADGARGRLVKIPRPHEPVVPSCSTRVFVLAALDCMGKKASADVVFNEPAFRKAGVSEDDVVTPDILGGILAMENGYLDRTGGTPVELVLTRSDLVDSSVRDEIFRVYDERYGAVYATSILEENVCVEKIDNSTVDIEAVLLAAGFSERFGSNKLLALFKGKPLVAHALDAAVKSGVKRIHVVVGESPEIESLISRFHSDKINVVHAADARLGMSASLKAGVSAVSPGAAAAVLLADMPGMTAELIDRVAGEFRRSAASLAFPVFRERRGHPVVFHPRLFGHMENIDGDAGGRDVVEEFIRLARRVRLESGETQADVDTPAGLAAEEEK